MIVYLAGPHTADSYRTKASAVLREWGHDIIDPMRDEHDYRGIEGGNVEKIVLGDLEDIRNCTHVLANFSENSVGTSMECWYAFYTCSKPVISFVDDPSQRISPWVHYISESVFVSLDRALVALCAPS